MPLNSKGREIKSAMDREYGVKKGDKVFYASENKGTITDVTKKVGEKKKGMAHKMVKHGPDKGITYLTGKK